MRVASDANGPALRSATPTSADLDAAAAAADGAVSVTVCGAAVLFTEAELALLAALPEGSEPVEDRAWCELEHGHAGLHYGLGQISGPTWWWLRWNDRQDRREFIDGGFCGARPDSGRGDCTLPDGHDGRHSFTLGTTE